jgi:tetratricopeptide (TPR) repeat protein
MKRKSIFLLILFVMAASNVFGDAQQPEKITDMGVYAYQLMEMSAKGDSNAWQILESLSIQMNEKSPVFKTILKEAENGYDRAEYLIGRFYLSKGKNEEAIKWLGKITNDRYRNGRFLLATALMNKARLTSNEIYYTGALSILEKLKSVNVEALANSEAIDFLIKVCEGGGAERKIFIEGSK